MPFYVFAKVSTPNGYKVTSDGPFWTTEGAEEFAMKIKNPLDHPDVVELETVQLREAKKHNRHLIYAGSGDVNQVPSRQYSVTKQVEPPEFQVEGG